jgi:hypothetical protein
MFELSSFAAMSKLTMITRCIDSTQLEANWPAKAFRRGPVTVFARRRAR